MNYSFTNEALDAILSGLNINENDVVLAVGGSGDQGFAMLEYAKQVKLCDINHAQVKFIMDMIWLLRKGDYSEFLAGGFGLLDGAYFGFQKPERAKLELGRRNIYLKEDGRLGKIRGRLDNLIVEPCDIFEAAFRDYGYTKLYLSNVCF